MSVILGDFQPINTWRSDINDKWGSSTQKLIVDETTERKYTKESRKTVRLYCVFLALGTPFVHSLASVVNVAYRVIKIATLSHFWCELEGEKEYNLQARSVEAIKDIVRVACAKASVVALQLVALYGIFRPYDGRKLYASIERAYYETSVLAPCFQPTGRI